jgi:hypothetical protein
LQSDGKFALAGPLTQANVFRRAPINVSYDSSSGNYSIAITGWFVAVKQAYNEYNAISGFSFDRQGTYTINFCFVSASFLYLAFATLRHHVHTEADHIF